MGGAFGFKPGNKRAARAGGRLGAVGAAARWDCFGPGPVPPGRPKPSLSGRPSTLQGLLKDMRRDWALFGVRNNSKCPASGQASANKVYPLCVCFPKSLQGTHVFVLLTSSCQLTFGNQLLTTTGQEVQTAANCLVWTCFWCSHRNCIPKAFPVPCMGVACREATPTSKQERRPTEPVQSRALQYSLAVSLKFMSSREMPLTDGSLVCKV